jgi:DNA polymerase III epsilon subunit-like protein
MDKRLVFFDLETGGLDPKRNPIIQLAAIAVDEKLDALEAFEAKIQFDKKSANSYSLRKNHYHPGVWAKSAQEPKIVAQDFAKFLRRHATLTATSSIGELYSLAQLVAHNSAFDGPFLTKWFERHKTYLPAHRLILCTMQLSMWHFANCKTNSPDNYKLTTLCRHLDVPFHAASAHDALGDVTATVRLYQKLSVSSFSRNIAA